MTRTVPAEIAASIASGSATLGWGISIVRGDGTRLDLVSTDRRTTIGAGPEIFEPGFDVQAFAQKSGLAVDNSEITFIPDEFENTREDIQAGRWDGAEYSVFQFDWAHPDGEPLVRMRGRLGDLRPTGRTFVAELRDLRQALQSNSTAVLQETCRYRLGDAKCTVPLSDFTESVEVTAVASQSAFTDSARTEDDDYFTEGEVQWISGDNAGLRSKVRSFADGVFELAIPLVYAIQIGDTATAVAGCPKSRAACRDKFDNVLNFGGEPDKPSADDLVAAASYS
jgi:uncharacterized phage protein (TIGR02218 family)